MRRVRRDVARCATLAPVTAPAGDRISVDDIVARLTFVGHETQEFEVKNHGESGDRKFRANVARAMLRMGNRRGGGMVLIGVNDKDLPSMLPGLTDAELDSWTNYDLVAERINVHADPPLRFEPHRIELPTRVRVAVLEVFEFDDIPHLCRKSFPEELREGALYVRPLRKPSTAEVPTSVEMRAVVQLAISKSGAAFIQTLRDACGCLSTGQAAALAQPTDDARFDAQQQEGWR